MEFTTLTVADITGLEPNYIKQLVKRGYVWPSQRAEGPGRQHVWTLNDVYRLKVFRQLMSYGMPAEEASAVSGSFPIGCFTGDVGERSRAVCLYLENGQWFVAVGTNDNMISMEGGKLFVLTSGKRIEVEAVLAINIDKIRQEVEGFLKGLVLL